ASHWKRMVLPDGIELSRGTHSTLKSLSFFASPKPRVYQAGRSCHARLESLSTDVADRVTVRVEWYCVPHFESVYPNKWWDGGQGMRRRVGKKLYAHHSSAYFVGCSAHQIGSEVPQLFDVTVDFFVERCEGLSCRCVA